MKKSDIEKEIAETEAKLQRLKNDLLLSKEPVYELATKLHELLCHSNHADGCAWDYEGGEFDSETPNNQHARYMRLALRLKLEIGADPALRAVKVLLAGRQ